MIYDAFGVLQYVCLILVIHQLYPSIVLGA